MFWRWIFVYNLSVCLSVISAGISPSSGPECRDMGLFQCARPIITFVMTADGQRIGKIRKSGLLKENDFTKVCRLAQSTISCIDGWIGRCMPANETDLHIVSKGTVKILSVCNETDSFSKFTKMTTCAEKINNTHKACGESMRTNLPEAHKNINPRNPKEIFQIENLQRHVCCTIKQYKTCITPSMQSSCAAEEKTLTDKFLDRVLGAYQCTNAVFGACVAEDGVATAKA
ncbi:uncharacterized protein LOC129582688 [Paramacrobiotus metropolitanus]|uniref:uncharacterized protein LOC129582688 n=1 Tax=Paramacrobiotus metropolitanus TaxID=2943436 RepID=UPI0024457B67|nr:uncharacterized protein LOC129582688 [Paramacrobiotus metropolitanus]